jgi:hypothetical protein
MRLRREVIVQAYLALEVKEEEGRSHGLGEALPVEIRVWW